MNAPTLTLGAEPGNPETESDEGDEDGESEQSEQSSPESYDPHARCSQVSSGWMGRAIMAGNLQDQKEKEMEEEESRRAKKERVTNMMIEDIMRTLAHEMGEPVYPAYAKWRRNAFNQYGDVIYGYLAKESSYLDWAQHHADAAQPKDTLIVGGFTV